MNIVYVIYNYNLHSPYNVTCSHVVLELSTCYWITNCFFPLFNYFLHSQSSLVAHSSLSEVGNP